MSNSRLYIKTGLGCSILIVLANLFFLNGCRTDHPKDARRIEGEVLAVKYCTSCHASTSPQLLDRETWRTSVLPAMGKKLGISTWSGQYFPEDVHAGISIVDWQKIVDYFSENSPEKLPIRKFVEPLINSSHFRVRKPASYDTSRTASTTMVRYNKSNSSIYTSDVLSQNLYVWSNKLNLENKQTFDSPVVDIEFTSEKGPDSGELITLIGSINPNDYPRGKVLKIKSDNLTTQATLAVALPRPVKSLTADFTNDGLNDIVVCSFGNTTGGLYLLKQSRDNRYEKSIVSSRAGSIQTAAEDFNKDGWMDIMCLFAQGDEGIWMYLNDRKGGFKPVNLLRFPPLYGSSSFQMVDFNYDGHLDILYTSGDNSDFSRVLKPYHGVYIFMNDTKYRFKQTFFYPINGSTKAVAADLDLDGDLDLATIAFFSDTKNHPRQSFMYLLQKRSGQFQSYSFPIEKLGKWLSMEVVDINMDASPDIILGNFSIKGFNQPGVNATWDTKLPFIVLENQFKQRAIKLVN